MLGPQCFKRFNDEETQSTCALEGAAKALGIEFWHDLLEQQYPWCLEEIVIYCPHCGKKSLNPFMVIIHLTDAQRWSREAIADWVEALEVNRGV